MTTEQARAHADLYLEMKVRALTAEADLDSSREREVQARSDLEAIEAQRDELKAENERLKAEVERQTKRANWEGDEHDKFKSEELRQRLRAEAAETALKPFAAAFHHANPASTPSDQAQVMRGRVGTAHFKRAASVLSTVEKG